MYEYDILWFDVPMQNFVFVHKRDGIKQVPDDEGSAFLTETGSG